MDCCRLKLKTSLHGIEVEVPASRPTTAILRVLDQHKLHEDNLPAILNEMEALGVTTVVTDVSRVTPEGKAGYVVYISGYFEATDIKDRYTGVTASDFPPDSDYFTNKIVPSLESALQSIESSE